MRHRLAASALCVAVACASAPPLPDSGARPADAPPAPPAIRTDGRSDGPRPRWIEFTVNETTWGGWCREEVWTPLDRRVPRGFLRGETWSRLGDRAPRRIAKVRDAVWTGPLARVRPMPDGFVDFVVEVCEGRVGNGDAAEWHGATVALPDPFQRTYRFAGRVPAGHRGPVARWGGLTVSMTDSAAPSGDAALTRFSKGFVAGSFAEYEELSFTRAEPDERDFDGVVQAVFRLEPVRRAAGFRDGEVYGEGITLDES